ncbi:putative quinol monooxygenase [Nocardioides acrostichi]|uniref:Antibiotic biosynthesis monooxygenase n=1 Tax=Nocardioides acrostichi TaxID=2784339 RepID=A0A930V3X8_9ACTN|nr:putative quinol monooxygenase [Nocardioides acrostichi]MBF4162769.1 antibiotic biosynthesis monooxygenase [Nocardioides acrostichi]
MSTLKVIATIPVKAEEVERLRGVFTTLVAATREEEGCLAYDLFESAAAPGTFVTIEEWTGQEALDAHMQSPHIATAFAEAGDAFAGEVGIHPLTPVR